MRAVALIALLLLSAATTFGQDSLNVTRVGELRSLTGYTLDVAVTDSLAFIGTTTGFYVLDITHEASLREVARVDSISVYSIAISGNRAYLGCPLDVKILDISDARHPELLSSVLADVVGSSFESIAVSGNILCAAAANNANTVYVMDVTDPRSPSVLDSIMGPTCGTMVMRDSLLYIGEDHAASQHLQVYDLHDPTHPRLLSTVTAISHVQDLEIRGDSLYVASMAGIYVVNVTDPAAPVVSATYDHVPGFSPQDLAVDGNFLYVVTDYVGPVIFDISIPGQIVPLDTISINGLGCCGQVESGNHRLFVTTYWASFHILSTEDPGAPAQIGVYGTPDAIYSIGVAGANVYMLGQDAFYAADVADPTLPAIVAAYPQHFDDFGYFYPWILVNRQWAYAVPDLNSWDSTTIHVFDISDPIQPQEVAGALIPGKVWKVVYDDGLLFAQYHNASSGVYGIRRIDVSDPADPLDTGGFQTGSNMSLMAVRGTYLYMSASGGLAIYNIADINAPYEVAAMFDSLSVEDVALSGNYAYVCADDSMFRVVNVSDPEVPVPVSSLRLPDAFRVKISGNLAFVGALQHGLRVIDVSNPATPVELGHYAHYVYDLCVQDSLVYTAESDRLGIYRWLGANSAAHPREVLPQNYSLAAYPNPFNPTTVLSFDVPATGRVRLAVYDITGRLVQALANRVYAQGNYRVSFDGANLSSGIYFARMSGKSFSRTQKLVLLK